ncbi:MAG: FAD-dependent oxidoreductase [Lautropia sp.]|nr:FAD-dependent oxidoreductase [Lautropia sp.]
MENLFIKNLVIGFGKAGKTLAADLAQQGQDVILVEASAGMYGGTCINIGCIPSKKLIVEGEHRAACPGDRADVFEAAMAAKNALIPKMRMANFRRLDDLERARVITGHARFQDEHTVIVSGVSEVAGGSLSIRAERIFINTGSLPVMPKIPGIEGPRIHDSTGILSLATRPGRLVIVGAGYIGLEFAFMYRAFGTDVTLLDAGEVFLPREDRDIAAEMQRILQAKGVKLVMGAGVERFEERKTSAGERAETVVVTKQGDHAADAVLVAVGRRPNTDGLDLERAGIRVNERGYIETDDLLRARPHIWAMGDVAGSPQFTYISLDDYRIVRDQLLGSGKRTRRDRTVFPTAVFTQPPLGHVGMTETAAQKSGRKVRVATLKAAAIPKAMVLGQTDGLLKAVVDADTNEILGVTLLCAEAHEIINLFKMAIDNRIPARYLKNQIFTHPTMAEALNDLFATLD